MYSRYLPPDAEYDLLPAEEAPSAPRPDGPPAAPPRSAPPPPARSAPSGDPVSDTVHQAAKLLGGLFKHFSLENLDTGDILLILIVLFLFLEKDDNLDLVIALGLMLLLSLGEKPDQPAPDAGPCHPEG